MTPTKRVLVIDDNSVNLRLTAHLVKKAGFIVDTAETAEGGLECLAENRPDLIVTDLQLPGMSGIDLTRAVKKNPEWSSIPVILLTASQSPEDETSARQAGCAFFVSKPVDMKMLGGLIAGLLGESPPGHLPTAEADTENVSITALSEEFTHAGARECRSFLYTLTAGRTSAPTVDATAIPRALHRWAGVGGMLGFPEITTAARAAEALVDKSAAGNHDDLRKSLRTLLQLFTDAVPVQQAVSEAPVRLDPVPGPAEKQAPRPLVLVADDDPIVCSIIRIALEKAGFQCRLAHNGMLALRMALDFLPDAIILDLNMPRMDGFTVLYSLQSGWSTRKIPVILLTASQEATNVSRGIEMGVAEYMMKPFDTSELIKRLRRLVRQV